METHKSTVPGQRFPIILLAGALALMAFVVLWLAWSANRTYQANAATRVQALRMQELRGRILQLDDALTTTARTATTTGEARSREHYREFKARLDTLVAEAVRIAPPLHSALPVAQMEVARNKLADMESAALDSVRDSSVREAQAILAGEEYTSQKRLFVKALDDLSVQLGTQARGQLRAERRQALGAVGGGGIALMALLAAGGLAIFSLSRWRDALLISLVDRERAEATLRRSEEYHKLFRQASDVILILDPTSGTVLDLNHKASEVYNIPREMLLGRKLESITHDTRNMKQRLNNLVVEGASQDFETVHFRADGTPIHFLITASAIEFQGNRAVLSIHRDITERKALEEQLAHQAFHDSLTGLANRALFRDRVEHAVARSVRHPQPIVVLFLDLDNFKTVNDSLGHAAGDQLLVQVAQRLRTCLRVVDTIARLGGDEFAILLQDARHPEDSVAVAERITAELRLPFRIEGKEVFVGTSIGIASSSVGDTAEELLRNADAAMYIAKSQGKGCYEIYEPHMHAQAMERLDLEADLRRAVERGEFVLHYQPIIDMRTGQVAGAEALVRWYHPERGLLAPGAFIPLAEETGLILPLGRWVLEEACRRGRQWQARYPRRPPLTITVNLSGRQLQQPDVVETVALALGGAGLEPTGLILEVTESVMMQNTEVTLSKLQQLRGMGVRIAIDDFGTGYSSLSYLQRFPVDILKIDKSFIDGVGGAMGEGALARAIIALGDTLRLRTIAEGVRSMEQVGQLKQFGCELGQGYYFAKPMEADDIEVLLRSTEAYLALIPVTGGVAARVA
jgi:diguanylate cyclase (GGDEF)-like protein/PAS domain S-box-containing protein